MRFAKPFFLAWSLSCACAAPAWLSVASASDQALPCSGELGQHRPQQGTELGTVLDVLSWNIQKGHNTGWAEDLASFSSGVELAFIQEASLGAGIAEVMSPALHRAFAPGYTTASEATGVLTLSATTPSAHCKMTTLEPWLRTPKATSITEYPLRHRDERLLAINLHAVNFEFSLRNFQAQFQALRNILRNHRGPVILAGDLNTWSAGRQFLVDTFMREHGLGPVDFEDDLRTRAFGRALDHIYVRGLRAEHARVIPVASSDHNPLRVRLALP